MNSPDDVKKVVKDSYANIARQAGSRSCCCNANKAAQRQSGEMGYSEAQMQQAPAGSNLGLGCGNPVAILSLKPGEVVLDLGSGAGFDVFLAAEKVGSAGKVIGVDMTDEMIAQAQANAAKNNFTNVEFRRGDIEALPLENEAVDVVISNCVINLAPDKLTVFKEAYRVLKPGGRMMISDVVLKRPLPEEIRNDKELLAGCISGAILKQEYLCLLEKAGFTQVVIHKEVPAFLPEYAVSLTYSAMK